MRDGEFFEGGENHMGNAVMALQTALPRAKISALLALVPTHKGAKPSSCNNGGAPSGVRIAPLDEALATIRQEALLAEPVLDRRILTDLYRRLINPPQPTA